MSLYLGSGFRCMASGACGFRVFPAAGDDEDLNEAARLRRMHERGCRFRGVAEPGRELAAAVVHRARRRRDRRLELEEREVRQAREGTARFTCTCIVCGKPFRATGPRSQYCPTPSCQAKRKSRRVA